MATAPHTLASLSDISKNVADWVRAGSGADAAGSGAVVRRLAAGIPATARRTDRARRIARAEPEDTIPAASCRARIPSDVARVEHLTLSARARARMRVPTTLDGPDRSPGAKMRELFRGCMKGRTLYVVPYCMGPLDSPYARCGVEITDSAYVVLNMALMTRMGRAALERIATDGNFVRGLHSTGDLNPEPALHHALPRGAVDRELRLRLWRQCAAGQEMPRAAHRQLAGARRRLARRAHAARRAHQSARRNSLSWPRHFLRPAARPICRC